MNRASVRWPLCGMLRDPTSDAAVQRCWSAIEARSVPPLRLRAAAMQWLAIAAVVVLLVVGSWQLYRAERQSAAVAASSDAFSELIAPPQASVQKLLSDGSVIDAAAGTKLQGLSSTPHEFSLLLVEGEVDIRVTPGGPRRWIVEAKIAQIQVVGTQFRVTRHQDVVTVSVAKGVVVVRSTLLSQGVKRMVAGEHLVIASAISAASQAAKPYDDQAQKPASSSKSNTLAAKGTLVPQPTAEELMRDADAARTSGDLPAAEKQLSRVVHDYPKDPRAPLAAYQLGAIESQRGQHAQAINSLRLALALNAPASLRQDCYLRLIEAEVASGQHNRAFEASQEYQLQFPRGRHRRAISKLLGQSSEATAE